VRRATPSWAVTGVLSLSGLVAALNQTLVIPLIPAFPGLLGVSSDDASWFVTATLVVGAVSIPTVSRLADMYGRRIMLLVCLVIMGVGAVISGLGASYGLMIVGRGLAGFGIPLIPIGISVLRDALPPQRVGTAVALMSATLGIGTALGLPLSGVLYETLGWRWAFWITAIVAGVLTIAVLVFVPHTLFRHGGRFDVPGAILLAVATASTMLVISKGEVWGWGSALTIGLVIIAVLALAVWVVVELRVPAPLVNLRTSTSRPVLMTNIAALLVGFALFINLLVAMQQLQAPVETGYGFGFGVLHASALMIPSGLLMVFLSPITGRLLDRAGGRIVLLWGVVVMSIGYVLRVLMSADEAQVVISTTIVSLGTAFAYAAMPTLIMQSVPESMTAAANGLNTLLRQVGTSTSSSAVAAALAAGTLVVRGVAYASWDVLVLLNVLAAVSCVAAAMFAAIIPRGRRPIE